LLDNQNFKILIGSQTFISFLFCFALFEPFLLIFAVISFIWPDCFVHPCFYALYPCFYALYPCSFTLCTLCFDTYTSPTILIKILFVHPILIFTIILSYFYISHKISLSSYTLKFLILRIINCHVKSWTYLMIIFFFKMNKL